MIVYLLLNQVNCKTYVGQTKRNSLAKRWNRNFSNVRGNAHFVAAVNKYGAHSFSREILAQCRTQEETDNMERLWICALRSYDPACGYNMQPGGVKWRGKLTPEARQRISEATKRAWQRKTPAQRKRFAEMVRQRLLREWQLKTDEERVAFGRRISRALRGRKSDRPAWNKGMIPGPGRGIPRHPHPPETRQRISDGLKRYYARQRDLNQRKPVARARKGGRNVCAI